MSNRSTLEEVFNLPPSVDDGETPGDIIEKETGHSQEEIHQIMRRADKIDRALPQVAGLQGMDREYDDYAEKAITAFEDLIELGKLVEDRHAGDIFHAAGNMMANAINAKTNKTKKKLEMIRHQIAKERLEHDKNKLEYLKAKNLRDTEGAINTDGEFITDHAELVRILKEERGKADLS